MQLAGLREFVGCKQHQRLLARTPHLVAECGLAFLSFPTKLVERPALRLERARVRHDVQLTLLAIRALGFALDAYARPEQLSSPPEAGEAQQDEPLELLPVLGGYLIAISSDSSHYEWS